MTYVHFSRKGPSSSARLQALALPSRYMGARLPIYQVPLIYTIIFLITAQPVSAEQRSVVRGQGGGGRRMSHITERVRTELDLKVHKLFRNNT
jgi:hypothetical protein